jgi:MGT family glycosyltransferase
VRALAHRSLRSRIEATGAEFTPYQQAPDADASRPETDLIRDWEARTPIGEASKVRDQVMFGPARAFALDTAAEIDRVRPDAMTVDFMMQGGLAAAEARGVPAINLVHIVWPLPTPGVPPFGMGLRPRNDRLGRTRDRVFTWLFERLYRPGLKPLNEARKELGLDPLDTVFDQWTRVAVALILTAPEFDFAGDAPLPPNVHHAGPVIDQEADVGGWDPPWPPDHPDPLVVASFSTTYQAQSDLAGRVISALGELPVRGLITTGPAIDVSKLTIPANVEVRDWVPHAAVLRDASLVVSHGGLGTVHAALAADVPIVCLPHGRDQEDNAARVVEASAGTKLPKRASVARLRTAIAAAVDDEGLREGAGRMATAFRGQDGATRVAEELEALGARP